MMAEEERPVGPARAAGADVELEVEVAIRVEGYGWVEWNHRALAGSPLDHPGRFLAHPGDFLSHLYVDAARETALARGPYRLVPPYTTEPADALRAAERAGVFQAPGVCVVRRDDGGWRLVVGEGSVTVEDARLPRALCLAAIRRLELDAARVTP